MRYAQIRRVDIANGTGIRTSLYVQGCNRHCPNCFNQETWDFEGGKPFTDYTLKELVDLTNKPHISGVTILGGEPMEPANREGVLNVLLALRQRCPGKTIWMYSSYLYEDLLREVPKVLEQLDVLVDGPFIEDLKDAKLHFKGSSNQRVIDIPASLKQGKIVILDV